MTNAVQERFENLLDDRPGTVRDPAPVERKPLSEQNRCTRCGSFKSEYGPEGCMVCGHGLRRTGGRPSGRRSRRQ